MLKLLQHTRGRLVHHDDVGRSNHITGNRVGILALVEHILAQAVKLNHTHQVPILGHHGEDVALGVGDNLHDHIAQRVVLAHGDDVVLHQRANGEHHAHRLVFVVGEELSLFAERLGVDGVGLKVVVNDVGYTRHQHKRNKELVGARNLGNEEHGRERSLHHSRHQARHTHQREGSHREVHTEEGVANVGHRGTREGSHKERGSKGTTHTARSVGEGHSHNLHKHNGHKVEHHYPTDTTEAEEGGVVEHSLYIALHKVVEHTIALAIERREEQDEHTDAEATHKPLFPLLVQLVHQRLDAEIDRCEVVAHQTAHHRQQSVEGYVGEPQYAGQIDREHRLKTPHEEYKGYGRHGGYNQWHQSRHTQIEHKNFQHEDYTRNGGLEDTRQGRCYTASQHQREVAVVHLHQSADVGTDGCTGEHDGGLGTHRTTKADGQRTAHHGGVAVVGLDFGGVGTHRFEHFGNSLGDVVFDNVAHKEGGKDDAHHRVDKVEPTGALSWEPTCQARLDALQ